MSNSDLHRELWRVWMIYGNGGGKHTHCNHSYLQGILEHGESRAERLPFYYEARKRLGKDMWLTDECIAAVETVFNEHNDQVKS